MTKESDQESGVSVRYPEASGWTIGPEIDEDGVPRAIDVFVLDWWTHRGLHCMLLKTVRYFIGGRHTRGPREFEERETSYVGVVNAPPVETPLGAYSGVRPEQTDDGDWFMTGATDLVHTPGVGYDTLREAVREQTNTLARGLRGHAEREVCSCGWRSTNAKHGHDDDCPAVATDWLPAGGPA